MRLAVFTCSLLVCLGSAAHCADDASVLFSDDFSTLDSAWGQDAEHLHVSGNRLVVQPSPGKSYITYYSGNLFSDADISVKISQAKGDADKCAGVVFWHPKNGDDLYVAEYYTDGNFNTERFMQGQWLDIVPLKVQDAVTKGAGQVNELRVVTKGRSATVYVNGKSIATFKGFPPDGPTKIGLYCESGDQPYTWEFSNLIVRKPQ